MARDFLIEAVVYVLAIGLASYLWPTPGTLLVCYLIISLLMLFRWHTRSDLVFYFVAFVFGSFADAVAVRFGAWEYTEAPFLIPIWLPPLWGIAALLLKKIAETFVRNRIA